MQVGKILPIAIQTLARRQDNFAQAQAIELSWILATNALGDDAANLLAARIAANTIDRRCMSDALAGDVAMQLLAARPSMASLAHLSRGLGLARGKSAMSARDVRRVTEVWPIAVSVDTLLASGGDDRLALDPFSGLNKYGCAPRPCTDIITFASCTASSLSPGAYGAAERARRTLIAAVLKDGYAAALRKACRAIETDVLDAFECRDMADAILTASGTDAALVVSSMLYAESSQVPTTSIMLSPAETGSGIPLAVQCRHFADITASGVSVIKGEAIWGVTTPPRLVTIELRDPAGNPLPAASIATACDTAIRHALPHGRVVLHAIDGSKTGLTAPGRACLARLAKQYSSRLQIVIDACQARVEPAVIRAYLEQGFPVLVTGSKFFGAPGFCGAILFPRERLARVLARTELPAGIAAYAGCESSFGSRICPGLLLRWTAALHELARFRALPDEEISQRLENIGATLTSAVNAHAGLQLIAAPTAKGSGWSSRRSVFTFTMQGERGLLGPEALRCLYLALQADVSDTFAGCVDKGLARSRCQVGQPVQLGNPMIGGLRLAISASQIVENVDHADRIGLVLNKLVMLSRNVH